MQTQLFYGKYPNNTIEMRVMVVWDGDAVVAHGSPEEMQARYPDAAERTDLGVRLALKDLVKFESNRRMIDVVN